MSLPLPSIFAPTIAHRPVQPAAARTVCSHGFLRGGFMHVGRNFLIIMLATLCTSVCKADESRLMAEPIILDGYACALNLNKNGLMLHVEFSPPTEVPIVSDAVLTMQFADGTSMQQGIAGTSSSVSGDTLRMHFQPDGIEGTRKLLSTKPKIESFFFRMSLHVPDEWEERTLPKLANWLGDGVKLGATQISIAAWEQSQYYLNSGGVTKVVPTVQLDVFGVGPAVAQEISVKKDNGIRLLTPDGERIESHSYSRMKFGDSTWKYQLAFDDERTLNLKQLHRMRLEVLLPGEGYVVTPPLRSLLPAIIQAGETRLQFVRRPEPRDNARFETRRFAFGSSDRFKGFRNRTTGELRSVKKMRGVEPYEFLSPGDAADHFLKSPGQWSPVIEVPTTVEIVVLDHQFDVVRWP